jgi:hypothetical protein
VCYSPSPTWRDENTLVIEPDDARTSAGTAWMNALTVLSSTSVQGDRDGAAEIAIEAQECGVLMVSGGSSRIARARP